MQNALKDCLDGKMLTRADALALTAAEGDELESLLAAAATLRDRSKVKAVTFSPKIFVPLTNLCREFCGYCALRHSPDDAGAKTTSIDDVLRVVRRG